MVRARSDWRSIDLAYAARLREGAARIRRLEPPTRVTVASVERLFGRRDWLVKRRAKLPLSCSAASVLTEDIRSFQLRRLRWHATRCRAEGVFDPWVLLRRAGLTGCLIDQARHELRTDIAPSEIRAAA